MRGKPAVLISTAMLIAGCTASALNAAGTGTPEPAATATPSPTTQPTLEPTPTPSPTPTATPNPTPSPTASLPPHPVLVSTHSGPNGSVYDVAVAPLATAMDQAAAAARAADIGALVGLGKPRALYQPVDDPDAWRASWDSKIQGIPGDPAYDGIVLLMRSDGTVTSFTTTTGPLAPRPKTVLTKSQALRLAKVSKAPPVMELVWAFEPAGSDQMRLACYMDWPNVQPDGEKWPCVLYLDAGTGTQLFFGCVM